MTQLEKLKLLLNNPSDSDDVLNFYLDCAKDIICDLRNSTGVETKYLTVQLQIAVELYNKRGSEGEIAHNEIGIDRTYEMADISPSLLSKITPSVKTPFSYERVVL